MYRSHDALLLFVRVLPALVSIVSELGSKMLIGKIFTAVRSRCMLCNFL